MLELTVVSNTSTPEYAEGRLYDADAEFALVKIPNDSYTKLAMKVIDKAEYQDTTSFVSRTGVTLPKACLSTGCKVAILTHLNPDKLVHGIECGV